MKTFLKMLAATIVAMGMAFVLIAHNASDNVVLSVALFGGIVVAVLLGVFNTEKRKPRRRMSYWRHLDDYRQAA